jgi:mevalonate pyrophosphate decarboxylase
LDAGPNVHVICAAAHAHIVTKKLKEIPGIAEVLDSPVGEGARIIH